MRQQARARQADGAPSQPRGAGRVAVSGSTKPRAAARPRTKKAAAGRWTLPGPTARRWIFILGFTLALLVGLPLAHALVGDVGAILLGTFAFGFVVGRMTLKR